MNSFNKHIQTSCVLTMLFTLSGCSYFGMYGSRQVAEICEQSREAGYHEGVASEVRRAEHQHQAALAEQQFEERFYRVPVPEHINEDGVLIEAHMVPVRIVTEKTERD